MSNVELSAAPSWPWSALSKVVLRACCSLVVAGSIIGVGHQHDLLVALLLTLLIPFSVWRTQRAAQDERPNLWLILSGMAITAVIGVVLEHTGISWGWWVYHNLSDNRQFPYWLPMAWGLAFLFLYRVELRLLRILGYLNLWQKLALAALVSFTLPTFGEMVTIALGVWTYYMDYQLLGVPFAAMVALMLVHSAIYVLFVLLCRHFKIKDPVFN